MRGKGAAKSRRLHEGRFSTIFNLQVIDFIMEVLLGVDSWAASAILATDKSPLRSEPAPYGVLAVETHG
jgi:hypothetical protein